MQLERAVHGSAAVVDSYHQGLSSDVIFCQILFYCNLCVLCMTLLLC